MVAAASHEPHLHLVAQPLVLGIGPGRNGGTLLGESPVGHVVDHLCLLVTQKYVVPMVLSRTLYQVTDRLCIFKCNHNCSFLVGKGFHIYKEMIAQNALIFKIFEGRIK